MTSNEVIQKLRESNRAEASRGTGIPYGYLCKLVYGKIQDPGTSKIEKLREYFAREAQ